MSISTTFRKLLGAACVIVGLAAPAAHAQICPFDSGGSTLENDGLVLTRYALGDPVNISLSD